MTGRGFLLLLGAGVIVLGALLFGNVRLFHFGPSAPAAMASKYAPGTRAEFVYLAHQNSNSCGLQPSTVRTYVDTARIQGSCCNPMDWAHYQHQVRDLRAHRAIAQIPRDPYDIPASLAKRLFADESSIRLTPDQQAVYDRAMQIAPEKGPCCCKCWRWHAFKGLAQYLIVERHYSAHRVAKVISLVDGCGGKG
jgi:hypothetical protein